MKAKFYLGILVAVIVGFTFASGVTFLGKTIFNQVSDELSLLSGSHILSANVIESNLKVSDIKIIEVTDENDPRENNLSESSDIGLYYTYPNSKSFPDVYADSYLVADLDTGQVIKEQNIDEKYPVASITKLITALVSIETLDQEDITTISPDAVDTYGEQGNLRSWQKISIKDLLYPLLLESSNDASEALAEHAGRSIFISDLNGVAKSIGMGDSSFVDPSGLSPQNISTARDLFKMMQYLHKNNSSVLEITRLRDYRNKSGFWSNLSDFRNDANYLGGKNGYTDEALYTLVTSFALPLSEDDEGAYRNIVIILLRSGEKTEEDTREIIYWLLRDVYYE